MKRYDLSKIMKKAWELVKKVGETLSSGLKKAWKEAKIEKLIAELLENLEDMTYGNYHIHAGTERYATAKRWTKGDKDRIYLEIKCFTLNGRFKRAYKAGYVDNTTGEYVIGKYDEVNALKKEYIES